MYVLHQFNIHSLLNTVFRLFYFILQYYFMKHLFNVFHILPHLNCLMKETFHPTCITPFMFPSSSAAHLPPVGWFWEVGNSIHFVRSRTDTQKQKQSLHISPAQKWSLDIIKQRCALLWTFKDNPSNCLFSPTSPAHSSVQVLSYIQHRLIHLSSTSGLLIFASFQNSLGLSERQ